MIGIILLIGIVKKNAIMMIDFALAAERNEGMNSRDAIYQACLLRFRPIMMTTMCALLGGMPLALGCGMGAELRRPLGIAIVGGLVVSQMLTLFTTPVIYLYSTGCSKRFAGGSRVAIGPVFSSPAGSRRVPINDATLDQSQLLASLLCSGCTVGPKYQRPVAAPPRLSKNSQATTSGRWLPPATS